MFFKRFWPWMALGLAWCSVSVLRADEEACAEAANAQIRIDEGHPWRPPFGLEKIGKPLTAVVEISLEQRPLREYYLAGYAGGKEIERHVLNVLRGKSPHTDKAIFQSFVDELVLFSRCRFEGAPVEVKRRPVKLPDLEADAVAKPDKLIHPVDLGTIFVPADWLLLTSGQQAEVQVAVISYHRSLEAGIVRAWFESAPGSASQRDLKLEKKRRREVTLELKAASPGRSKDVLHVAISDGAGKELWHKKIQTMLVANPPQWPAFGATETKLRYDPPISVRNASTGELSTLDYEKGWAPGLKDVVVTLPNGSRFVFWRGSSYIPFWAGRHSNGLSYEWAETTPPPDGFVDSVEPLMDKELRYGRVKIIESTPSRVHVRWSYQSTDFTYKVWGDSAVEDFYFYPDGFGTRVMSLKTAPGADYELSEFIILTPQSAYPFDVLPRNLVDMLFVDGEKRELTFPFQGPVSSELGYPGRKMQNPRKVPILYRIRLHKEEPAAAIYFNPNDKSAPIAFSSLFDRGQVVTPAYWGSHWPLARGTSTGWSIDDRIHLTPAHNSTLTWGMSNRPEPLSSGEIQSIDALGQSKTMIVQRWAWLIGMTDSSDTRLLEWAQSFSRPASLEVAGAKLDFDSYVPERRAYRLNVEDKKVAITVKPVLKCVNPVFELAGASGKLVSVTLDRETLRPDRYAWDGKTLWVSADVDRPQVFTIVFQ